MKSLNTVKKRKHLSKILALVLTLCLTAGILPVLRPAFAESEFKYASPFKKVGKATYYHKGKYTGNLIVNGVDISDWQSKKCDFIDAKKDGVDFAILRVTYTNTSRFKKFRTNCDDNFAVQYENAKDSGVMTGVYVFSQAKNASEGRKEAEYAVKRLKALGIGPEDLNLPVYMDYEFSAGVLGRLYGLKKTDATNAAAAFCNTIKSYGYKPGIYANTVFFGKYLDFSKIADDVDLWCAQYYSRCESGVDYSKWQYSSSARIDGLLSYTGFKGNIDADFWYINKDVNPNAITKIRGRTILSVSDAQHPKFKIYDGSKLLTEGVDYNVGGIRNNVKGNGYAYISGIGKYSGYALVPIKVRSKTKGSVNKILDNVAANYMTYASAEKSTFIGSGADEITEVPEYKKGETYTVQTELNMRKGPGTNYAKVKRSKLSVTMKKNTLSGTYAVLKPGVKVKCTKVSGDWIKVSGGWICGGLDGEIYVK
ncbi:MAG: hypothetical protein IJJ06_11825 [Mogibacterium sp.]|nr:hypothetical protein [Mogibacterium sp.]